MPDISSIRIAGNLFYATIGEQEVPITTFRESLWRQDKVYLPPPFTERCDSQLICCDVRDSLSDPMWVSGCIHDPWTAAKMAAFALGRLDEGIYEKPFAGELDHYSRYFRIIHQVLADPNDLDQLPRMRQCRNLDDFQRYWKTLYYLLHALIGWDCIADGLAWWYSVGKNARGDARLELINAIWDDDGQLDYFAAHCWRGNFACGAPEELSPTEMVMISPYRDEDWWRQFKRQGLRFPQDPFYGGSNPLHLDAGCCLEGALPIAPLVEKIDVASRRGTLVVGDFSSWRDALGAFGRKLPPDTERSWHVDVFDRRAGYLGLFRQSRLTGRWFQGKHNIHMRGHRSLSEE